VTPWEAIALPAPWLGPYEAERRRLLAVQCPGRSVADALNAALMPRTIELPAGRLCFVEPLQQPAGEAYEAFIARTASVPTRDNLHDLLNGLVWLRFPHVKRRLNELHAAEIARIGIGPTRGVLRDALTLFDENGACLQAPPVLIDALRGRDWRALFVTHRAAWDQARLTLFGHALLEKLARPRKPITAHVWLGQADEVVERLGDKPLPLPVLGVPGWWPANEAPAFYDDASVFRPGLHRGHEAP